METIPVVGHSDLVRDKETGAIININSNEIKNARQKKLARRQKEEELEELKNQVQQINNDLSEIKQLLQRLVQ